jgi:hypothetical protein
MAIRSSARRGVELLARNEPLGILCRECKAKPATQICTDCQSQEDDSWLCDACVAKHACDPEMLLPVVNSPRAGVCGYCG